MRPVSSLSRPRRPLARPSLSGVEFAGRELDMLASARLAAAATKSQWLVRGGTIFMLESTFASWLRRSLGWLQSTSGWSAVHFGWDLRSDYYVRVQDACCRHLFHVLLGLLWTAGFQAIMAACGPQATRCFVDWKRRERSHCCLHRGLLLECQCVGRVGGLRACQGREHRVRGVACARGVYGTQRCRGEQGAQRPLMIF